MSVSFRSSSLSCGHWAFASRCTFQVPCQRACDRPPLSARCNMQYSDAVLLPSTLSAVKLRSLWIRHPSPKVALTLLTIKSTSCVLPFRLKFLLRVKRAYRRFLLLLSKVTQRHFWHSASKVHCALPRAYLDAVHRDSEFSLSAERRHFGLCKSKSVKHRIVFLRAHCGTRRIAGTLQHASIWTISSLARIFPYATSIEILVATAPATSFLSSAVM